jgi:hypothetical protein
MASWWEPELQDVSQGALAWVAEPLHQIPDFIPPSWFLCRPCDQLGTDCLTVITVPLISMTSYCLSFYVCQTRHRRLSVSSHYSHSVPLRWGYLAPGCLLLFWILFGFYDRCSRESLGRQVRRTGIKAKSGRRLVLCLFTGARKDSWLALLNCTAINSLSFLVLWGLV